MTVVEKKILLDVPVEPLWEFITNPGHFHEYVSGYTSGEVTSPHSTGLGSTFRWKAAFGPFFLHSEEEVVGWIDADTVVYKGQLAGVEFTTSMSLKPSGSGAWLRVHVDYDVGYHLVGRLLDRALINKLVDGYVSSSLENLSDLGSEGARAGSRPWYLVPDGVRSMYSFWGKTGLYDSGTKLTFLFREHAIRKGAVDRLELRAGDSVLDLCCGTGLNFPYLMSVVGTSGSVTGVDYTRAMLDRAERRCRREKYGHVELLQGDASRLCLPDAAFDGVLCVLGISAVVDFKSALRHVARVCRRGGRVVICDGHEFSGIYKPLNTLMVPIYRRAATWDNRKDIIGEMEKLFSHLSIRWFNGGTIFIASCVNA